VRGTVVTVEAVPGQTCRADQVLLVLESMKMEVPLACPCDAEILHVLCSVGEVVEEGAVLAQWRAASRHGSHEGRARCQLRRQAAARALAALGPHRTFFVDVQCENSFF
jgi:pyruvate/2-oxoglutarate dehydrogenase complex dihydrolipoamide acyltransferase (E2) component